MTALQKPPERDRPANVFARMVVLLVLLLLVGVAVWAAVTGQRIDLTETTSLDSLEREDTIDVGDSSINLQQAPGGPVPVVLLHDFDVAGSVLWDAVAEEIGEGFHSVRIDLPGFGLSERLPGVGDGHTVSSMATVIAAVISERLDVPVVVAGVGLGGKVAAELAVTNPDLVRGLVLVDVDFGSEGDWVEFAETLPFVGRAVVHTFEAGGPLALDRWAPNCDEGGWCPTADQIAARGLAASVAGTTDSLHGFRTTPTSSLVPSDLGSITVPVSYVWSTEGAVPAESVEMVEGRLPEMSMIEAQAWKAHLESPGLVVDAIEEVGG